MTKQATQNVYILIEYHYSNVQVYGVLSSEHRAKLWKARMNKKEKCLNYDYIAAPLGTILDKGIY